MTPRINLMPLNKKGPYPEFEMVAEDAEECRAAGFDPDSAVVSCIANSLRSYAVLVDGRFAAVLGYDGGLAGGVCRAWLLTGKVAHQHPLRFGLASKRYIEWLHQIYPTIEVVVDTQHLKARKWLRWLGFLDCEKINERLMLMRRDA